MNILEYCNQKLSNNAEKKELVATLVNISNKMKGRSCFKRAMTPGDSSSFVILLLNEYFKSKNIEFNSYLEVGVLFGGSLCALYESGFQGTAYGLDIYEGYYGNLNTAGAGRPFPSDTKTSEEHMKIVYHNCKSYGGEPVLIKANTQDENFDSLIEGKIDDIQVLYIDGDHTYKGAIADYNKLFAFLKKEGILLVDNFEISGVREAVKEIKESDLVTELGMWNNTMWIGVKN